LEGIDRDRLLERLYGLHRLIEIQQTHADRVRNVGVGRRERERLIELGQRLAELPGLLQRQCAGIVENGMALPQRESLVRQDCSALIVSRPDRLHDCDDHLVGRGGAWLLLKWHKILVRRVAVSRFGQFLG
jgi:hypothetical protein